MSQEAPSVPNPLCEVGRTHPRDRHRMKPLEDHPGVWQCQKHGVFATVLDEEAVEAIGRGDPYTMHDGQTGIAGRTGDDRPGGVVFYYRPEHS